MSRLRIVLVATEPPAFVSGPIRHIPLRALLPIGRQSALAWMLETIHTIPEAQVTVATNHPDMVCPELGFEDHLLAGEADPPALIQKAIEGFSDDDHVLILAADLPCIEARDIEEMRQFLREEDRLVVPMASTSFLLPGIARKSFDFYEGEFCPAHALAAPCRALRRSNLLCRLFKGLVSIFQSPLQTLRILGDRFAVRMILGQVTFADAGETVSRRLGAPLCLRMISGAGLVLDLLESEDMDFLRRALP